MEFYLLPPDIVEQYQNHKVGSKGLSFVQDIQGRWVVNTSVAPLWPLIEWSTMQKVHLTWDDFPKPEM
jgi:hypothetical protein